MNVMIAFLVGALVVYFWAVGPAAAPSPPTTGSPTTDVSAKAKKNKKKKKSSAKDSITATKASLDSDTDAVLVSPALSPSTSVSAVNKRPAKTPSIPAQVPAPEAPQKKQQQSQKHQSTKQLLQAARKQEAARREEEFPALPVAAPPSAAGTHKPDMDLDSDDEGELARVLRVKGPEEVSANDVSGEDGWSMVDVVNRKPAKPRSISIRPATTTSTPSFSSTKSNSSSSETLTKKQRENQRKAERVKLAKQSMQDDQSIALREHRRNQERAHIAALAEKEKAAQRERALARNGTSQNVQAQGRPATGTGIGGGIWD
ncbi:hypothetical protein HKX48_001341 [Thoreauomyces humboldtii]|nr:hypothetical protein HKX48_001341 [Thoreauomyces humboldtii]